MTEIVPDVDKTFTLQREHAFVELEFKRCSRLAVLSKKQTHLMKATIKEHSELVNAGLICSPSYEAGPRCATCPRPPQSLPTSPSGVQARQPRWPPYRQRFSKRCPPEQGGRFECLDHQKSNLRGPPFSRFLYIHLWRSDCLVKPFTLTKECSLGRKGTREAVSPRRSLVRNSANMLTLYSKSDRARKT